MSFCWWVSSTVCVHVYVCAFMCMQHIYESLHYAHPPFWLYEVLIKMYFVNIGNYLLFSV